MALALVSATSAEAESPRATATATFSMYCYWTGEATLGRVPGVEASRIGHWGGAEIVQVDYDPTRANLEDLVAALKKQKSFYALMVTTSENEEEAASMVSGSELRRVSGDPHFIEP